MIGLDSLEQIIVIIMSSEDDPKAPYYDTRLK